MLHNITRFIRRARTKPLPSSSEQLGYDDDKQNDQEDANDCPNPHMGHHHILFLITALCCASK